MDKSNLTKPKLTFPVQNRSKNDTKNRPTNLEPHLHGGRDSDYRLGEEVPDSKKPRLGDAPVDHIQILNQNQEQMILGHTNPQSESAYAEVKDETLTIYKSMHTVMEGINNIVDEAKFFVSAMNRMSESKHVASESPGASHPIPSSSNMKCRYTNTKKKCSATTTTRKDDGPNVEAKKIGQRRKRDSEFGNVDDLQSVRPRPLMVAQRLIFGREENEPMDCND